MIVPVGDSKVRHGPGVRTLMEWMHVVPTQTILTAKTSIQTLPDGNENFIVTAALIKRSRGLGIRSMRGRGTISLSDERILLP